MTPIEIQQNVLSENEHIGQTLRERFAVNGIYCSNFISAPGAGKTALLERTLSVFPLDARVAVLTGDIQTDSDVRRLARYGFPVRQISTVGACHLDASMVERALAGWNLSTLDYLMIENVGNLMCSSSYDLGENDKIVVLSVTEGEEKPLQYPATFSRAGLVILNKVDLLPYVPFDIAAARDNIAKVNPAVDILEISCATGAGLNDWCRWLEEKKA